MSHCVVFGVVHHVFFVGSDTHEILGRLLFQVFHAAPVITMEHIFDSLILELFIILKNATFNVEVCSFVVDAVLFSIALISMLSALHSIVEMRTHVLLMTWNLIC